MLLGKRVTVMMPADNAEKTLEQTYAEIPHDIVDHIILVDDCSKDRTVEIAQRLGEIWGTIKKLEHVVPRED